MSAGEAITQIMLTHAEKHAGAEVVKECTTEKGYLPIEVVEGVIEAINAHREQHQ